MTNYRDYLFDNYPEETKWLLAKFSFKTKWGTEFEDTELFEDSKENRKYKNLLQWIVKNYGHTIHRDAILKLQLFNWVWRWNPPGLEDGTSEE